MTTYENYQKETSKEVRIVERSLLSSRHVFLEHMRQTGVVDPTTASVLDMWHDQMLKDFKAHPHVIVYLHSSPEVAYARMQSRARGAESTVTLEYLQSIHSLHETWLGRVRLAHAMEDFHLMPQLYTIDADQPLNEMQKQYRYCLEFLDFLNST
ncbi:hypothetical protein HA402_014027 [Bradysia odoriphaga]|nr:hypothetical protein HA402_014027 [Bradysia odoriphaga]